MQDPIMAYMTFKIYMHHIYYDNSTYVFLGDNYCFSTIKWVFHGPTNRADEWHKRPTSGTLKKYLVGATDL